MAQCVELAVRVEEYPYWHPEVVRRVVVQERDEDRRAARADATLRVALGPLRNDYPLIIAVSTPRPGEVLLERQPYDASDHETFTVRWRFDGPVEGETQIRIEIDAELDVPRLAPVGGLGNAIASGFVRAACQELDRRR